MANFAFGFVAGVAFMQWGLKPATAWVKEHWPF